jgi:hypothetical protein
MAELDLQTEAGRQRALAFALALTEGTRWAPSCYERELLDRFVWGELTLDEVIAHIEGRPVAPLEPAPFRTRTAGKEI